MVRKLAALYFNMEKSTDGRFNPAQKSLDNLVLGIHHIATNHGQVYFSIDDLLWINFKNITTKYK
tara:strand:+ start:175 stop:369 length:195 start_codon:yes stop_codon:yes gene_type:complete